MGAMDITAPPPPRPSDDAAAYGFGVSGMSCAACVGRVERVLARAAGGGTANLSGQSVRVPATAPAAEVARALAAAGFPARETVVVLEVEGMTCASCVARVEAGLAALPGVLEARVNLAQGTARLRMLEGAIPPDRAAAALTALGYPAAARATDGPATDRHAAAEAAALARALTAAALTLPLVVLEMGGHLFPAFHHWQHATFGMMAVWAVQAVLATLVLAFPGRVFLRHGLPALARGAPDMNALVAMGAGAAWAYSMVALLAPGLLPPDARAVWFEAAAVIVTLILAGRWMEARARGQAGAAIRALMALAPQVARVERGGRVVDLPVAQVVPGDVLHLPPGAQVAVDGQVLTGTGHVDESMLTGEPMPVAKAPGDPVTAGCLNGTAALTYRAERVGADTTLARIVAMVEAAQATRLPVQDLVNRITAWFVPAVMTVAAATVAVWLLAGPSPAMALVAGVSVLIIACPCAMGLAVPTSILVGTGRAARLGVLFRQGSALQSLRAARVVAFDKTGTLTQGRPDLTDQVPAPGADGDEALRLAAAVEAGSEHPLARAILAGAVARGLALPPAGDIRADPGFGITALVEGQQVAVGAARMLARDGIDPGPLAAEAGRLATAGRTPVFVVVDGQVRALLGIADPIKPEARAALDALRAMGRRVVMVTGDDPRTADAVGRTLGLAPGDIRAGVLPGGKVDAVTDLRAAHGPVAFVGDGINDAPALAAADTGLALGTGTDVAIAAADVVLMRGHLSGVVAAFGLSAATLANIRQNLIWAFGYNIALIPVAAGALYPTFGITLSPMLAAGAMAASSLCVLANALRLARFTPDLAGDPQ